MRFLILTVALVALAAATFAFGSVSVNLACALGGLGFAILIGWATLS